MPLFLFYFCVITQKTVHDTELLKNTVDVKHNGSKKM